MSDLSDLDGIYPNSIRWNAEQGYLGYTNYNSETGEREVKEIDFGQSATFVLDLATRERGYGRIRVGEYDMHLTPVGHPPPPRPGGEHKPAIACWLWTPTLGELRCETCATMFREAIVNIWDECRFEALAVEGMEPVIRFSGRVSRTIKSVGKSFFAPVITRVGWVERDRIPGWKERAPTVLPPTAIPMLPGAPAPEVAKKEPIEPKGAAKPGPDGPDDPDPDDSIPF